MVSNCESCGNMIFETMLSDQSHKYVDENGKESTWSYALLQCKNCGLGFISPKPSWAILQTFYTSSYGPYSSEKALPENESRSLKYKMAKWRFASCSVPSVKRLTETTIGLFAELITGKTVSYSLGIPLQMPKDCRILEVGYGSGNWLLSMAMLGYSQLSGYDIDSNQKKRGCLEQSSIKVYSGQLLDSHLPGDSFDLIRLEHVFEHLLEPIRILRELHRLLKPGGILVMNFPSINAISFDFSPLHCAHRDSPRHLYLHTMRSAQNMLTNSGFKIAKARQYGVVLVLQATINNFLKERGIKLTVRWLRILGPLYNAYCVLVRRGENITVLALKEGETVA